MARKKKVVVAPTEKTPVAPPVLTVATKEFISNNFNKISTQQIAESTGLTEQQVLDFVHNVEREVKAPRKKNKYGAVKGEAFVFDESKSAQADIAFRNTPKPNLEDMYGKDVVKVEFKPGFGE